MLRRCALLCLGISLAASASAQTGWITLTNSVPMTNLDGSGDPINNAEACFQMTNNSGQQIGVHIGIANGHAAGGSICTPVTNGTITPVQLPDTSLSTPQNACISLTITSDVATGGDGSTILGGPGSGYACLQPAYSNTWCITGNCDLSKYVPTTTPGVIQTTGAPGAAANLSIGSVVTGAPGSSASATITGTAPNFQLSLNLPAGSGGVAANPAGGDKQVQYNTGGTSFGADSTFSYNYLSHMLSVQNAMIGTRTVTSCSTQAALQTAIYLACSGGTSASYGYVSCAPGAGFSTSLPITVPSYCHVDGGGQQVTEAAGSNTNLFNLVGTSGTPLEDITIENFFLNGNGSNNSGLTYQQLINIQHVNDSTFKSISLSNAPDTCLHSTDSARNVYLYIEATGCGNATLTNANYQGTSFFLDQGTSDTIAQGIYTDTSSGQGNIVVLGTTADPSPNNSITQFKAKNAAQKNVVVLGDAPYTQIAHGKIESNAATANGAGIYVSSSSGNPDYSHVDDVQAFNCGNVCFELSGSLGAYSNLTCNTAIYVGGTDGAFGRCFYMGGNNNNGSSWSAFLAATDGIGIFGSGNVIDGIVALNNGTYAPGTYAGVVVSHLYSLGYNNSLSNIISGNAGTSNQGYGLVEESGAYSNTYGLPLNFPGNTAASAYGISGTSQLGIQPAAQSFTASGTATCPSFNASGALLQANSTSGITITLPTNCPGNALFTVMEASSGYATIATSGPANGLNISAVGGVSIVCSGGFCFAAGAVPPRAAGVVQLSAGAATVNTPLACLPASSSSCRIQYNECQLSGTAGTLEMQPTAGASLAFSSTSNTDASFICWAIWQ